MRLRLLLITLLLLPVAVIAYTQVMVRIGSGTPPPMAASTEWADAIHVNKSDRRLDLLQGGEIIRSYTISLGAAPENHKQQEGDERTPEGTYVIDWRNQNSVAHLSLHISYPNEADIAHADAHGVSPGGNIMIHGVLNGWGFLGPLHRMWDWTNGCIAVTNAEMQEIWSLVPDGTPITIDS
ncbi:L,D-transpeptidase family protein [Aliiroseovarius sp. YM-037]|uniref:L,D-transpeptidase family protein n=1 Tax=Aliiroseovarius sp. YM-037 TaxID=3341728 RepID=UPI003A7FECD0